MSATTPVTYEVAFAHAEKLMGDGLTLSEIKSMLRIKGERINEQIANLEAERDALRKVYAHLNGISRNAAATNIDGLITNRKPVAPVEEVSWSKPFESATPVEQSETVAITSDGRRVEVPNGTFTVVMANERRTIKIADHWDESEKARGTRVAKFLTGSDNERDFTGFAFISATGKPIIWKKYRNGSAILQSALAFLLQGDNYAEAGYTYALESGNCWKCGRKLTVPASISRGVGPECAKKLGL